MQFNIPILFYFNDLTLVSSIITDIGIQLVISISNQYIEKPLKTEPGYKEILS